jgi:hypothetical protein
MIEHDRFLFLAAKDLSVPLAPDETAELDAHLVTCPVCTADSAGFQRDHQALVRSLNEVSVGAHVLPNVLGRAAGSRRSSLVPIVVAAALLILGLVLVGLMAGSPRPTPAVDLNGVWNESPGDGVITTVTISGSGSTRLVEFIDLSGARCGGDESSGAGSGVVSSVNEISGEFSRVQCQDGSDLETFPFRYTYDEDTGLLRGLDGVTYRRVAESSPAPSSSLSPPLSELPSQEAPTPSADVDLVSGNYTYSVNGGGAERAAAVEARGSDRVTGTWTFQALPDGAEQTGPITCLVVRGSEAFLFGPSAEEGGRAAFTWVIDGGADGDRAITWIQDLPTDPLPPDIEPQTVDEMEGWCRNAGRGYPGLADVPPVPLLSGSLSVHDAP